MMQSSTILDQATAEPGVNFGKLVGSVPSNGIGALRGQFEETGFVGPFAVLTPEECRHIRTLVRDLPPPLDWNKGHAATSRLFFELGMHSAILDRVSELLGDDLLLWGASLLRRRAGKIHPWHTDIETSGEMGGTVTVWIGLTHTNLRSSLQLVSHSHRFGRTLQEQAAEAGKRREERTSRDVEMWAKSFVPESGVKQFDMTDGEALFFDGRLWHGSNNTNRRTERTALILQYAVPQRPIRIPNLSVLEWPFQSLEIPRPPCIMVRGTGIGTMNRLVAPPVPEHGSRPYVSTRIEPLDLPLEEDEQRGWKPYPIFRGPTAAMSDLSCHVSVLSPGTTPHEPHAHDEEELLIVLSEEAELVIVDEKGTERIECMEPGRFVYYPAQQVHTIRNAGDRPVTYLMFKWVSAFTRSGGAPLQTAIFDYRSTSAEGPTVTHGGGSHGRHGRDGSDNPDDTASPRSASGNKTQGFAPRRIFEGPTRYLHKVQGHLTTLSPGHGYPPHVDAYDVAIITLSGTVETLGRQVAPHSIIFYAAGEPHGMKNTGDIPATYLVFEFHGAQNGPRIPSLRERLKSELPEPLIKLIRKGRAVARRAHR